MTQREFNLRLAFESAILKDIRCKDVPSEWLVAVRDEIPAVSSRELAMAMAKSWRTGKIVRKVTHRIAKFYSKVRDSLSSCEIREFDNKLNLILKKASHMMTKLGDDADMPFVAIEMTRIFYEQVFDVSLSSGNAMLDLLSKISLGPENTGQRKLNVHRTTENHVLVSACIKNGSLDVAHLSSVFMRSPSLHTLFVTQFVKEDVGIALDVTQSKSIREMLKLPPRTDYCCDMGASTNTEIVSMFGSLLDDQTDEKEEEKEEREDLVAVPAASSASSTPDSKRVRFCDEGGLPLTPESKRRKGVVQAVQAVRADRACASTSTLMKQSGKIVGSFRVVKGCQVRALDAEAACKQVQQSPVVDLMCYETMGDWW